MPYYQVELLADNMVRFGWDKSLIYRDSVSYTLQIATTPNFSNIVKEQSFSPNRSGFTKLS